MTADDSSPNYLRENPAQEQALWRDLVLEVCRQRKNAPPHPAEWQVLVQKWHHNKMPLTSVDELTELRASTFFSAKPIPASPPSPMVKLSTQKQPQSDATPAADSSDDNAVLTLTNKQLQSRLERAHAAGREAAWRDMLERFDASQRQHLANLMAHDWTISAVEIQTCMATGSTPDERLEATVTTDKLWPNGPFKPKRGRT